MAISAPAKSAQFTLITANPPAFVDSRDMSGLKLAYAKLTFTAAGFTTTSLGDISLIRMPAGKIRIYTALCDIQVPVGTATSDFDLGYSAHVNGAGTAVVADPNAWIASGDVGGAALAGNLSTVNGATVTAAVAVIEIETRSGFDIVCSFDTADSPAAGDMLVVIAYTNDVGGS